MPFPPREQTLVTENLGVNAVEALALREGLAVARPLWDHDGIDLIVYSVKGDRLKAVGVQVKSYSGTTWRIDTKYHDGLVMAFVWNANTERPTVHVMTAGVAKRITTSYTQAHNRRGGRPYDPSQHNFYTMPTAPQALRKDLATWEVAEGKPNTLRKVCRL